MSTSLSPSRRSTASGTSLRRSNGESVFTEHGAVRFTTRDILDAEQRLLETATQRTRYGLTTDAVAEVIGAFEKRYDLTLDEGQRALVLGFAADPRRIVVGIGPAGAGKTTAMRAVAEAWRTTGRRVVPLAPSAAAAEVLATELGLPGREPAQVPTRPHRRSVRRRRVVQAAARRLGPDRRGRDGRHPQARLGRALRT